MIGVEPALYGCAACALGCWLLSLLTHEHGWIDRLWSLAPVGYAVWFAAAGGFTLRGVVMAACVAAWGLRLTYNFWRKGGYRLGGEDYRWKVIEERMSRWQWALFNIFYIAISQNALLLGFVFPASVAAGPEAAPFNALDAVAACLFAVLLVGETVADEQQWRFHQEKQRRRAAGEEIERGFLTTGLFRYSRHPNFFCEMGMWWAFYLFSVAAGAGWLNITVIGTAILTLQFQGSTAMTEKLSLQKYPAYAEYQKTTSRLVPWFPRSLNE